MRTNCSDQLQTELNGSIQCNIGMWYGTKKATTSRLKNTATTTVAVSHKASIIVNIYSSSLYQGPTVIHQGPLLSVIKALTLSHQHQVRYWVSHHIAWLYFLCFPCTLFTIPWHRRYIFPEYIRYFTFRLPPRVFKHLNRFIHICPRLLRFCTFYETIGNYGSLFAAGMWVYCAIVVIAIHLLVDQLEKYLGEVDVNLPVITAGIVVKGCQDL